MTNATDFIRHAGVKGMKWGVRKRETAKTRASKLEAEVKGMSDADLRQKINRLSMEKQYKELANPSKKAGENFVKKAAKQQASSYIQKFAQKGAAYLVTALAASAAGYAASRGASNPGNTIVLPRR